MEVQHDRIPLVLNAFVCGVCFLVRTAGISSQTLQENYIGALKVLRPFFGEVLLRDITITDIRRYQAERGKKAGPYLLNSEISVLQMIMKEARCWKQIADLYKPMRVPKRRAGHSISAEEERILREVAFSRPKWRLAAHCMMVMLSTTMGFGELRHVRRQDVDLKRKSILFRDGAKNDYRDRTIPMNAAALDSMLWILESWAAARTPSSSCRTGPAATRAPGSSMSPWAQSLQHSMASAKQLGCPNSVFTIAVCRP